MFRPTTGPVTAPVWGSPWAKPWMADAFGRVFLKRLGADSLLPGISVVRPGAGWCPPRNGKLREFPTDTPAFEAFEGRPRLRVDPWWTNSFCNKAVGGGLTLGVGGSMGLSGRPLNKATVPSGTFNYAQVGGANTLSFTATSGQFVDISMQGYVGAPTGPMPLGLNVVNAITTGAATNATYSGFKISNIGVITGKFLASGVTEVHAPIVDLVAPGLWKFSWLLRYTQGATVRDTSRMYLEILDGAGSSSGVVGDGVSAVHWELCQHTLSGYHPPLVDTTTAPATVGNSTLGLSAATLGIPLSSGFSFGGAVTVLNRLPSQYPSVINFRPDGVSGSNETVEVFVPPTGNQLYALVRTGPGDSYGQNYVSSQTTNRFAMRASANNFCSAFNGVSQPVDLTGAMPATNYIQIGRNATANLGAMLIDELWVTQRLLSATDLSALSIPT